MNTPETNSKANNEIDDTSRFMACCVANAITADPLVTNFADGA